MIAVIVPARSPPEKAKIKDKKGSNPLISKKALIAAPKGNEPSTVKSGKSRNLKVI